MNIQAFTKFKTTMDEELGCGPVFGINVEATARALRELADAIDRKEVSPIAATVTSRVKVDDWNYTYLTLEMSERVPKALDGTVKLGFISSRVDQNELILSDIVQPDEVGR